MREAHQRLTAADQWPGRQRPNPPSRRCPLLSLAIAGIGGAIGVTADPGPMPDNTPPQVIEVMPPAGATVGELTFVEVVFDENVIGVEAEDLQVNGQPALGLQVHSPRDYSFALTEPAPGPVQFTWAPGHGITDLASPPNAFAGDGWSCTFDASPRPANVILSEFLANNDHGLRDDFGERSDWIELLNLESAAVDLEGWFLTDDAQEPDKWRLPAITLAAGGYLLVWASERDRADPTEPLHANFKLGSDGEYLALLDARTNVVSEFAPVYPEQRAEVSFGRDRADPVAAGFYPTPTPGAPNSTQGAGFAPAPVFSLAGGVYPNTPLTITLSASGGTVRYTLNGTVPTEAATAYTGPLVVSRSTVIHARVFQDGLLPGPIRVETYNLLGTGAAQFSSNLPLLILHTAGRGITAEQRVPAFVTAIEPFRGRATLRTPPQYQGKAQIELRGQSSLGFPKKAYNLELNDPSGLDVEAPLLGLPEESDWVLYAPYSDKPFLQNFLAYELHEQMGHYAARRRFIELFVDTTAGTLEYPRDYAGIYLLVEKLKVDQHRVDIARLTPQQNAGPEITGGYMIKKDKDSPGDRGFGTSGGAGFSGQYLKYHEPKPREITPAQQSWIRNYVNQFEKALYATDWRTRTGTNHYAHYIDADSFVDNHWIVEFPKQIDGYRLSNYLHKDRGGKLKMDPIWDWNLSFGNADYLEGANPTGWYYPLLDENDHIWLRRLISGTPSGSGSNGDPDFNQRLADRWSELRTNLFAASNVLARVDEMAAYLDEAQVRDFARWPRLGTYVWPNPPLYSQPRTYAGIITNLKNWISQRYAWIDRQFVRTPEFSWPGGGVSPGFLLALSGPTGTIYYTMDGADPRQSGGGVAVQARTYGGPFEISDNRRIIARVRNGTKWSGPSAGSFVVREVPLVITELMYHPAPPASPDTNDVSQFEYIELKNGGTAPLDLRGFQFVEGIQFSFATGQVTTLGPGARVLLVKDAAAFTRRYGVSPVVAGEFAGSLANAGERLCLRGPAGEVVHDFRYEPDWHPATDGLGFALVAADEAQPRARWALASGWRTGTAWGGTPGLPEPPPPDLPGVVVNEVLAHTDPPLEAAIELHNPGAMPADIGGWFLTDDRSTPKYRIPPGTRVPPGGYAVFTERDFNPTPGVPPSFNLRASGDEVFLLSADATGQLTGYQHGFQFGASLAGDSLGRHVTSHGAESFVRMAEQTFGAANSPPRVGPVVISEVMYRPPDLFANGAWWDNPEHEFIELHNLEPGPVPLFDPNAPTNTWRLRDAVRFTFPTNTFIGAGERLLIVGFDPVAQPELAAGFRAAYGVGPGVRWFGPFDGKLANGDDRVELVQPDLVRFYATNEVVTAVQVDRVAYRDQPPWPSGADGLGFSLQRWPESAYGDDPAHWIARRPTPGRPPGAGSPPVITRQPVDQVVAPGTEVTLTVQASDAAALSFQWRRAGENLPGATAPTLALPNAQPAQSGEYLVVVRNADIAVASRSAKLVVAAPPTIVRQPAPVEVRTGEPASFSVVAASASMLRYQWRRDGQPLPDATGASLSLAAVQPGDEGEYTVVVADDLTAAVSAPAWLSVLVDPVIVQPPLGLTGALGGSVTFSVAIFHAADLPITYQWHKDGVVLVTRTLDARVDFLTLSDLEPTDVGRYTVTVANPGLPPPGFTSEPAQLEVVPLEDADGDGLPDAFERRHHLDPGAPSDAVLDADADGATNLEEYQAGTDPRDPLSVLEVERIEASGPVRLRFRAVASRTYAVLYRDAAAGGVWETLAGVPATAMDSEATRWVEIADPSAPSHDQRFYRLAVPGRSAD